ncbi:hypothetical protein DMN91_006474 [Ooceraea biroi]|uniref:Uncharacterized protein n=1 Tax=Ooceraea biroi TaxID=2015173 RepID=A0A026VWE6_OOCBI|nr:uncharacterized protein LOC105285919 [Ooceraea biroi]EZA48098.1 hypothetical protein X777_14207 [Ooceraea biroi]RLU22094.1 hypothetical protein DMN91_006474 [Ooceraea biroi]
MWILCALIGLFQLILLLMLSGILFSIAAVSRLMEITVILIYPAVVFLLRQFANLIILLTILAARMTSSAFHALLTLVKYDQEETVSRQEPSSGVAQVQLGMQTPFVSYKKSVLEEIPEDILPTKDESSAVVPSVDQGIIEPPETRSQDNAPEEATISSGTTDS